MRQANWRRKGSGERKGRTCCSGRREEAASSLTDTIYLYIPYSSCIGGFDLWRSDRFALFKLLKGPPPSLSVLFSLQLSRNSSHLPCPSSGSS